MYDNPFINLQYMTINETKIYFAGSIRGGRAFQHTYEQMIALLGQYGKVLTEHVGSNQVFSLEEDISDVEIYSQDIEWLKQSDVVVAEVSQTSTGVGYELGYAAALGKKVICFYSAQSECPLSAMIKGNCDFEIFIYTGISELLQFIAAYFDSYKRTSN